MTTDSTSVLEALHMPVEMRLNLCMDLLESAGADKIRLSEDRGEIIHCCVTPWHNESRPSASLNFEKMTYKCLGCDASGGILWLIATVNGLTSEQAREWLGGQTGFGGKEFHLAPLLQYLDALQEAVSAGKARPIIPAYSEAVLKPWDQIYPGLTTGVPDLGIPGRGIPERNLIEARVGWDMDLNRVVIPHFWKDRLVGWQSRRLMDDGSPKYLSTPDFPRDSTLYRPPKGKRVVVVESPMSQLRHAHQAPITATFGFVITPRQMSLLKYYPEVVFWMDNDPAGWSVIEGTVDDRGRYHEGPAQMLTGYSDVRVVPSDWAADPADLDDDAFSNLLDEAVPWALWEKPASLRCLSCQRHHGGPCS